MTGTRLRTVQVGDELGRYQLVEELGSGGMATVFRARDRELRRDVAVKVLFPHLCKNREVVSRFMREARAAAALDHRHILRVFDVGGAAPAPEEGEVDPPYIVLELVRGVSLDKVEPGEPPLAEIVAAVGVALCGALAQAHRAGVIHRDVKPGNVLVAENGRLVLGDFGVARVMDDESSVVTRTGALLGTPAFMSPEQATGGELDARSDLYSLGATLYQLATGSLPVTGNAARAVAQIAAGEVIPPLRRNPRIGVDLARIIERLMRVDAGERYATAGEAEAALRELVERVLKEPDELLREYFADPAACQARIEPVVVRVALEQARAAAASGNTVRALAMADRVLALQPDSAEALAVVDDIGRGRARRRAAFAGIAVVAAAAGSWGAMSVWPGEETRSEAGEGAAIESAVEGAAPESAIADSGMAEAAIADAAVAETVPTVAATVSDAAVAPEPAPTARRRRGRDRAPPAMPTAELPPDAGAPAAAPPEEAVVDLAMDGWCDVKVGGKELGQANPRLRFRLAPGTHTIQCARADQGLRWSRTVTLAPGQRQELRGAILPRVVMTVAIAGGDAIRINRKQVVKNGATTELRFGHFLVEVMRGGQPVGSRYLDLAGRACTLRDRPRIECVRAR